MSYDLIKAIHIIAMTAWMAGMFYLPRLYAYHVAEPVGSPTSETFKIMERRLLRFIMNPAMILTLICGLYLAVQMQFGQPQHWLEAKISFVLVMLVLHMFFARTRRMLAGDARPHAPRFYKIINEAVTLVFIVIVLLVVTKPF